MPRITPFIWFDNQAEQAADFYLSIFPNSKIVRATRKNESVPEETGEVMVIDVDLDGQPLTLLNGGPFFTLSEAFSLVVHCADQAEVDHYWNSLLDGGQASQCGWLKDRFGLSWQIVPDVLLDLMADPDRAKASRVAAAMMKMVKLDIAPLQAAASES
jgi:predicted 3-demethylubiquinone-9 3-methyltransferase (glyoxalase superfamily)